MGLSFAQTKEIFGEDKATEMFRGAGLQIRRKTSEEDKAYRKLSESAHGKILHQYLDSVGLKHTHIGNESGQGGSKNIIIMMAKKKAQGVSKGYPDYKIYIPTLKHNVQVSIELKKAKGVSGGLNGSEIKEEQKEWIAKLNNTIGCYAYICHGSTEAIELVDSLIGKFKDKTLQSVIEDWHDHNNRINEDIRGL